MLDGRDDLHLHGRNEPVNDAMAFWPAPLRYLPERGRRWLAFVAAGAPSFLAAIPLNIFLVQYFRLPIAPAYAIVLLFQVTLNFVICRHFVFDRNPDGSIWREFLLYVGGISVFRFFDWLLYTVLVYSFEWNFVAAQVLNIVLFSALKFLYSERVF